MRTVPDRAGRRKRSVLRVRRPVLFLAATLLLATPNLPAQVETGVITGFVYDDDKQKPLPSANLVLLETNYGAAADGEGRFTIRGVPPGHYSLRASVIGFGVEEQKIFVSDGKTIEVNFHLSSQAIKMSGIFSRARRREFTRDVDISTWRFNAEELRSASVAEPDLFRTLQLVPGVTAASDFSSALYVRGGTPDQNLILLDGATIYNPFHLSGFFSTFNSMAIDNADFSAGGFTARYGGRISSVLDINNKAGHRSEFHGGLNFSLLAASGHLSGPLPRGSFSLAARRTYLELWRGNDFYQFQLPFHFYDFQGKAHLDILDNLSFTASGYYGDDFLDRLQEKELVQKDELFYEKIIGLDVDWGNRAGSLELKWVPSARLTGTVNYSRSIFFTGIDVSEREATPQAFDLNNRVGDTTLRAELLYGFTDDGHLLIGAENKRGWFDYRLDADSHDFIGGERHPETNAAYIDMAYNLRRNLVLSAGLRYNRHRLPREGSLGSFTSIFPDYTHELRYFEPADVSDLEPRFGIKYRLSENTHLKFSSGLYHQYLTTIPIRDEALSLVDIWFPIDGKYEPLRAEHYIIGIEQWLPLSSNLVLELYQKRISGLLERDRIFDPEDPASYFMAGEGDVRGVELLFRKSGRYFYGWLAYSYSRAAGRFNGEEFTLRYDRRHTFNFALYFNSWDRRWDALVNWTVSSGLPYTPVLGKYRTPNYGGLNGKRDLDSANYTWKTYTGPINSVRYPAYHRMDISVSRRYFLGDRIEVNPFFQAINVYGQDNILVYRRTASLRQRSGETMLPFTPTVGLRIVF
ncbi:carboxypeptidase-like regulatory domain-containing protein [candidate division KSB1 bacterium]